MKATFNAGFQRFFREIGSDFSTKCLTFQLDLSNAHTRGQSKFKPKPAITKVAAPIFHGGSISPRKSVDAPMPKIGTSKAIGAIVVVG